MIELLRDNMETFLMNNVLQLCCDRRAFCCVQLKRMETCSLIKTVSIKSHEICNKMKVVKAFVSLYWLRNELTG